MLGANARIEAQASVLREVFAVRRLNSLTHESPLPMRRGDSILNACWLVSDTVARVDRGWIEAEIQVERAIYRLPPNLQADAR